MDYRHKLHELLYVSVFDPSFEISAVTAITTRARTANKLLDITGLLVFDGENFCQYLEGGMKEVVNLFSRIQHDARHGNVALLHQGTISRRSFVGFNLGFSYIADNDVIGLIGLQAGPAARDMLFQKQELIDLGSG